ncbi:hypothetical protein [Lacihabitans lacunae]|uniref:Uncharacterized protein n=1 Tax=Lacihabitans lacunae TaxID=1028214 RepID=A0ABV7YU08_9BACT
MGTKLKQRFKKSLYILGTKKLTISAENFDLNKLPATYWNATPLIHQHVTLLDLAQNITFKIPTQRIKKSQ